MEIAGSILGIDNKTVDEIKLFTESGIDYIHLDIMDNKFVNNFSLPYEEVENIIVDFKP